MKFSLNHLLLLVLIVVVFIQGVQVFVDRNELQRLKRMAFTEEAKTKEAERRTGSPMSKTKLYRRITANYQSPADFDAAAKRFQKIWHNGREQ